MDVLRCNICNNIVVMLNNRVGDVICCGSDMEVLTPNIKEYAKEKHLPEVSFVGKELYINIGEINHPMKEDHYIEWVCVETNISMYFKYLKPGEKPFIVYRLNEGEVVTGIYSYCNIHGLWKTNINYE